MKSMATWMPVLLLVPATPLVSQFLPPTMYLDTSLHLLVTDGRQSGSVYDESKILTLHLIFEQPDYWQQLVANKQAQIDIPATLVADGDTLPGIGVRFKGQTSYQGVQNSPKKSFNLTLDFSDPDQNWEGYETLNLNNGFQDASFMREVLYLHQIRRHVPAAKACFVRLFINGEDWGLYPHIQQLNGQFLEEWFFSNDGSRWRADVPAGTPPGGGGMWGDGTAAFNYLGTDTAVYQKYYDLKKANKADPWEDLIAACDALNNTPSDQLLQVIPDYFDLDRTLWFLATEILFSDDDSYVYKGKMDYYFYWDPETARITPLEYDGNSVMKANNAGWSPFFNANKVNYPLLNRLLAVPEIRQRYLAHFRTLLEDALSPATVHARIDEYAAFIAADVQSDPKKLYTYAAFNNELNVLKNFVTTRYNFLKSHAEIAQPAPEITDVNFITAAGLWEAPGPDESALIRATVQSANGISRVRVFWSTGLTGPFEPAELYDDGTHGDEMAGDGIYSYLSPVWPSGTWVRFYVEASADNPAMTVAYSPAGAEHDVYIYQVRPQEYSGPAVVINEIMADNDNTAQDEAGDFDDWIELFNVGPEDADLGGYYFSDKADDLTKWTFPDGTFLAAGDYLIVWADEQESQGPLHADFKLSKDGEGVYLTAPDLSPVDAVDFGAQETDMGYARIPNGTGDFVIQAPTFASNNEGPTNTADVSSTPGWILYPNPAGEWLYHNIQGPTDARIADPLGRIRWLGSLMPGEPVSLTGLSSGIYFFQSGDKVMRFLVSHP